VSEEGREELLKVWAESGGKRKAGIYIYTYI
jgi:hypothetical protein